MSFRTTFGELLTKTGQGYCHQQQQRSEFMQCRLNDEAAKKSWFRSDRFFTINNQWYFATRECANVGPFTSLNHAQNGLELFLKTVSKEQFTIEHAENIAKNGEWSITYYQ